MSLEDVFLKLTTQENDGDEGTPAPESPNVTTEEASHE
jgi:hypothetical protein